MIDKSTVSVRKGKSQAALFWGAVPLFGLNIALQSAAINTFLYSVLLRKTEYIVIVQERGGVKGDTWCCISPSNFCNNCCT